MQKLREWHRIFPTVLLTNLHQATCQKFLSRFEICWLRIWIVARSKDHGGGGKSEWISPPQVLDCLNFFFLFVSLDLWLYAVKISYSATRRLVWSKPGTHVCGAEPCVCPGLHLTNPWPVSWSQDSRLITGYLESERIHQDYWVQPLAQDHPQGSHHMPECVVWMFLKLSQAWCCDHSLATCSALNHSLGEEPFPNTQPKPPLTQFWPFPPILFLVKESRDQCLPLWCPVRGSCRPQWGLSSVSFCPRWTSQVASGTPCRQRSIQEKEKKKTLKYFFLSILRILCEQSELSFLPWLPVSAFYWEPSKSC